MSPCASARFDSGSKYGANELTSTVDKLRRHARRLDKLNVKVSTVLAAMKHGEALHMEYVWHGRTWRLSGGRRIPDEVAQIVIQNARCRRW
jgi:hypothetical protein